MLSFTFLVCVVREVYDVCIEKYCIENEIKTKQANLLWKKSLVTSWDSRYLIPDQIGIMQRRNILNQESFHNNYFEISMQNSEMRKSLSFFID